MQPQSLGLRLCRETLISVKFSYFLKISLSPFMPVLIYPQLYSCPAATVRRKPILALDCISTLSINLAFLPRLYFWEDNVEAGTFICIGGKCCYKIWAAWVYSFVWSSLFPFLLFIGLRGGSVRAYHRSSDRSGLFIFVSRRLDAGYTPNGKRRVAAVIFARRARAVFMKLHTFVPLPV